MLFNIDCDGVLIPNTHEDALFEKVKHLGLSFAETSHIWDWYGELIHTQPLPLNIELLKTLQVMKNEGHTIRLWTNRAYTFTKPTIENLGGWKNLFDSFQFYSGRKHKFQVEGVVVDNNTQYLHCGQMGILYPSF